MGESAAGTFHVMLEVSSEQQTPVLPKDKIGSAHLGVPQLTGF